MNVLVLTLLLSFWQSQSTTPNTDTAPQQTTTSPGTSSHDRDDTQSATTPGDNLGTINGHVAFADKPAKGALVILRDPATGYSRTTMTDQKGDYVFDNVASREWTVEATVGGSMKQTKIEVENRQTRRIDFALDNPYGHNPF